MNFNINDHVWLQLTESGFKIHREYWEPFSSGDYKKPLTSWDGWSRFQMHEVMRVFGPAMKAGGKLPFGTTIKLAPDMPFIQRDGI